MESFNKVAFKSTKKSRFAIGLVLLLLGLAVTAFGARIFIGYMTASKELTKCTPSTIDNGYYKFSDIWTVVGQYGYDDNGTGYILWIVDDYNPDNNFFMGMYFDEKDVDTAEKTVNAFWDAYDNYTESTVYLSGAGIGTGRYLYRHHTPHCLDEGSGGQPEAKRNPCCRDLLWTDP